MQRTGSRRLVLVLILAVLAGGGLLAGAAFVVLRSPFLLTRVAARLGYDVAADTVALSPTLSGDISGLSVTARGEDGLTLLCAAVQSRTSLDAILQGEIDSLVLQNPKLTYRIGGKGKGSLDLSFLAKLPAVRHLEIRNAEARFPVEGGRHEMRLSGAQLSVMDFSPRKGGRITFEARFALSAAGEATLAAEGTIKGSLRLTSVLPKPEGTGSLEVSVESGAYADGARRIALRGLSLALDLAYDRKEDRLRIGKLRAESRDLGLLEGTAEATLRGEMPWQTRLAAASVDLAQAFGVVKPFIPEEYRAWSLQGKGAVEAEIQGTYAAAQPTLQGRVTFSFSQGGFSSPDSSTAAQGASGKIVLKLQYAAPERKVTADLRTELRDGEYLWGKFYSNLEGQQAVLLADGSFFLTGDRPFELKGSLDLFQTGVYGFAASGRGGNFAARLQAEAVSHRRLVALLLQDTLKGLSARLDSLTVSGTSALEADVRREAGITRIAGTYRVDGAAVEAPGLPLSIRDVAVHLPFDLVSPRPAAEDANPPAPGLIRITGLQRRRLAVEEIQIPLQIARNRLEVPTPVGVPFFGGIVRLYGVEIDDVLAPGRGRFGLRIEGVDLGRLTRRIVGMEYPGRIDADFGLMHVAQDRVASDGLATVRVFGGEIEARNFFVEHLFSPGRRLGGDFTFRDINLEEVTKRIAIGKMTGIVEGRLSRFTMEYDQPASFTLEVESVARRGVSQRISTEAIQSISVLGTGADNPLNRGITQFFREYPYSKIGFRCILNNDQFSVNGTIHDGGMEYLVRRGFLRGVDVVNQNPENVISFKDMQERISRLARQPQMAPEGVEVK
jgi:hypothetical protein